MPNKEQFVQQIRQYMDMIFRLAFNCLKSQADADDVTQTVLLRLYETEKVFDNEDHLKHWLVRVTLNECKKHWRSPWNRTEEYENYVSTLVFDEPQYSDLFEAIMGLDTKYRIVIYFHYYEGYSIEEIAGLLRLPRGTVGTRLKRAREQLKQKLSEEAL